MKYRAGQIVEGKVSGIQPYGAFVELDEHISGLIH
ncbi:MAG: S1 RNA-binding domain-containing protein, partial [Solobacterium sp.]|nr:S1 RNA-binding domain-containing protein [Solobacterium sp.]